MSIQLEIQSAIFELTEILEKEREKHVKSQESWLI